MSVWLHYWHERAVRAEQCAARLAAALLGLVEGNYYRYSPEDRKMIRQWALYPPRESSVAGPVSNWAERAGNAEGDSDRLAALLESSPVRHEVGSVDALQRYGVCRDRRYKALPVGPTLQGNLASGGVTEF